MLGRPIARVALLMSLLAASGRVTLAHGQEPAAQPAPAPAREPAPQAQAAASPDAGADAALRALLAPGRAASPAEPSELDRIDGEFEALARRSDAAVAADAIAQGRAAGARARRATASGQVRVAERAAQLAWSALSLASLTLARDHARRELAAAERRLAVAMAERDATRALVQSASARLSALRAEPQQ